MNSKNVFCKTRKIAEDFGHGQERNKQWWENAPMTYKDWNNNNRELKTPEDFDYVNLQYIETNPFLNEYKFSVQKDNKVLEIGCGAGSASVLFAKQGADVTAIDITEQAIIMTKNNAKFNNVKLVVQNEDAENVGLEDESFDYVYSWGVLHHSENTEKAFSEVSRVLKTGGKGLIMVYNKNSIRYYLHGLKWLVLKGKLFSGYNLEKVQRFFTDGYYHRHFTPDELKAALENIGLVTDRVTITHMSSKCLPYCHNNIDQYLKSKWGWLLVAEFHKD